MKKILLTAYKHMRRSPYQALSAIMVLTLTFFLAAVYFLVMMGSEMILQYFETKPQVTVFFKDSASEDTIKSYQESILQNANVKEVTYVSKDEALQLYKEQNKDDPLLLEMVTADILPSSLEISATDVSFLPEIATSIKNKEGVEEVVFQEDVVNALSSWTKAVRISGIALLGFLTSTSVLIILIIVGLKISSRKIEIGTLRLVGATNWYIVGPFIIEGVAYGLLGSFFAWGFTYLLLLYSTPFLVSFLGDIPLLPVPVLFMLALLGGMLALGTIIGSIASLIAARRFLKK